MKSLSSSFRLFSCSRYIFGNDGEMSVKLTFPDKILKRSGLLVCYQYLILQVIHTRRVVHLASALVSLFTERSTGQTVITEQHCRHWSRGSQGFSLSWEHTLLVELGKNSLLIFNSGCCMNVTTFVCFFSITSYFDFNSEFGINIYRIVTLYSLLSVYSKMKSIWI